MTFIGRRDALVTSGAALIGAFTPLRLQAATPVKIGMVGAGRVASNLAKVWIKAGHRVMLSSRHPEELKDIVQSLGPNASAGSVTEAVKFGDVILLAVPYNALPQLAKDIGAALGRKTLVLDASNPIANRDGDIAVEARAKGAGDFTAQMFLGAHIVRAFNALPAARMSEGGMKDGAHIGMPIAGDDKKAIALAMDLIRETGFDPVLVGPTAFGKYLMPGTPLAGEHSPEEIRKIAATLS